MWIKVKSIFITSALLRKNERIYCNITFFDVIPTQILTIYSKASWLKMSFARKCQTKPHQLDQFQLYQFPMKVWSTLDQNFYFSDS